MLLIIPMQREHLENKLEKLKDDLSSEKEKCIEQGTERNIVEKVEDIKPVKNLSKLLRNYNSDDEIDFNYNVKVSNTFSPLKALDDESRDSVMVNRRDKYPNVKKESPGKLDSYLPIETGPSLTDLIPNTSVPSSRPCSSEI